MIPYNFKLYKAVLFVFIIFKKSKKPKQNQQKSITLCNCIGYVLLYKFIYLINKPVRKKNIICKEFIESLYKLYYNIV